jgi:4a-hydroxytetrahydrobiopterin dehydratase
MTLNEHTITAFIADHPHWTYSEDALHTTRTFATFMDALAAINTVAHEAEAANHHPDLFNSYTTVTIRLTSHDTGAVTDRDVALAAAIDAALAS